MSRENTLCGCHLGFMKCHIPCQKTNYLKLQNNCIYALPISRFRLPDILVFIAESTTLALRIGNVDITGSDGLLLFQIRWRYIEIGSPSYLD